MTEKPKARFTRGKSGNPKGRPRGVPDRRAALRDALRDELPAIVAKLVEAARAGDIAAASLILSRCLPPLRPSREPVTVEGIDAAGSATETARGLIAAAVRGELPTDAAAELIAALGAVAKLCEVDDLARRIEALENRE